jgi:hypothetical protein
MSTTYYIHSSISILYQRQSLLRRYAYFTFVHIFANFVAMGALWVEIGTFNSVLSCSATDAGCEGSDRTSPAPPIKFVVVYFVVGAVLLGIELCESEYRLQHVVLDY